MKVHNTLTRSLDEIVPHSGEHITLYTCGLTVYSQPHIGNWVAYIYWDVLVRTLKDAGYKVTRVQNITDVGHLTSDEDAGEDKMLKGALKEGITAWQVADKYIAIADDEAYTKLGLLRPDHIPRATEYIPQQIHFVQELEQKGYTYTISDGVYFDTAKLPDYGALARLDIDGLQFGARVADTGKRNPTDFAVWKFSDPAEKRDMEWESPWGIGFPGWHLECSVMAREILGDQIDIHTGGIDHIPVHHTNEIAQTEAVTGKQFASYWLHNNHLKVDGEKMSKSLGNIYTLQDIQDKGYDLEAFKITILSKHYRTEGNFTWEILDASQNRLNAFRAAADQVWQSYENGVVTTENITEAQNAIRLALLDDLNTSQALTALSKLEALIDSGGVHTSARDALHDFLNWVDATLGLTLSKTTNITAEIIQLLSDRAQARVDKDWARSDQIRNQLRELRLEIKDTSHGQVWSHIY